jgi:hypothetical protein
MKLGVEVNEVVLSNVTSTGEFRIRNSAKAFSILSSGLYSNKIRAIIRELSCNALDSHVGAGKADVPFEVHLPTVLEPWFSVRDFGLGLDGNQVKNIYTTYFESTKTDSNDFIGALGLGSKSPFSYTENFTVTAVKAGTRRIYSAFINEMGVPSIAEMSKELTDEVNGVEVKFSVTNRNDYNSFKYEADNVFQWFKNKPIITGAQFTYSATGYKEENIVPGVHILHAGNSVALMGNIAYPLTNIAEPQKHFGDLASLLRCNLAIEFDIGELDFAASREELSYVSLTINSIKRKLEELNKNLTVHFAAKADAIQGMWAKADFLYNESRSVLYSSAVKKYAIDTKFPLYDATSYMGKKVFKYKTEDLAERNLSVSGFSVTNGVIRSKISNDYEYINGGSISIVNIPVDSNAVIVLNDLKTGCDSRAKYHFTQQFKSVNVYCISHTDADIAVRQVEYDKLLAELYNPPVVLKASELEKREPVKREPLSNIGIAYFKEKSTNRYYSYTKSYGWAPHKNTLDDTTTYYYVCLNGHSPETPDGHSIDVSNLRGLMDKSGISAIQDIVIYGVRKNRIKEIKDRPNWVLLEDKLKKEIAKVPDSHILGMVATDSIENYTVKPYTSMSVAAYLSPSSDYTVFANECNSFKKVSGNVHEFAELCAKYGKSVSVAAAKEKFDKSRQQLAAKYPLLQFISGASSLGIAEYINLIDKKSNT